MATLTTPRLLEQSEYFRWLKQERIITNAVYKEQIKTLKKEQEAINKRSKKQAERREAKRLAEIQREVSRQLAEEAKKAEEKRLARNTKAREKRAEKKINALLSKVSVLFNRIYDDTEDAFVWQIYNAVVGTCRVLIGDRIDKEIDRPPKYSDFRLQFFDGSQGDCIIEVGERVIVLSPNTLEAKRLIQKYSEGISHCVFTPIKNKLNTSLTNAKSKDTVKRIKQKLEKIKKLETEYSSGVPEDKMEMVAIASGFKIHMYDVLGMEIHQYNERGRSSINFTNTRPNHLDEGMIALNCDSEYVDADAIRDIYKNLLDTGEFFMIDGDINNGIPRKIRTLENVYEVRGEHADYFEDMDKRIGVDRFRLNATKYPDVNEFIKEGRIINAWVTSFSDCKPTGLLDMPKAYTQFKKSPCYDGFLGVIHQFRNEPFSLDFVKNHIGIYKFVVKNEPNELLSKLGIIKDNTYTLPSPEILYFIRLGLCVDIVAGVWGSKMDFDFPPEMLVDRRYCYWSGRLGMERHHKTHSFKCDRVMASHLKAEYGDAVFYWQKDGICSIRMPNKGVYTTHHILAFITSYTRIQMIDAMMKFDINNIIRVVLDGIYFKGEKPMGLEWFVDKEVKDHSYNKFNWYDYSKQSFESSGHKYDTSTCLTGQGGAGKTFSVFNDIGFNKILFVSPNHMLGGKVASEYKVAYTTIHKLVGIDCEPYKSDHPYPPVIFIDELTQIPDTWIDKALELYQDSFIFVAGDVLENGMWFQCRGGTPGEYSKIWKPTIPVVEIKGDRRSLDTELADLKIRLREYMISIFKNGDEDEPYLIKAWAKKNLKITQYWDAVAMFKNDIWISGTNKTSDGLLVSNVVSGYYKQGGFISFIPLDNYKKRGSFTCHSFQGQTIEPPTKVFISINDLFEWSMLYTAISRARKFDQLVFVV
jgi:hypothetical protein